MAGKDIIMVRQKDLRRLHVIHKAMEGIITQKEAAALISLSERQVRRIVGRIREKKGITALFIGGGTSRQTEHFPVALSIFTKPPTPILVPRFLQRRSKNGKALS